MNSRDALTGPINLGNPTETTILQLAETIIALSASPSTVVFKKLPHDDPKQRKPDITLAHKELDWEPVIPLETGLKRTIAYFDQLLKTTGAGQDVAV
jgi:UDP-glucuronate decarboxylase